jgi:hypothetical protein
MIQVFSAVEYLMLTSKNFSSQAQRKPFAQTNACAGSGPIMAMISALVLAHFDIWLGPLFPKQ